MFLPVLEPGQAHVYAFYRSSIVWGWFAGLCDIWLHPLLLASWTAIRWSAAKSQGNTCAYAALFASILNPLILLIFFPLFPWLGFHFFSFFFSRVGGGNLGFGFWVMQDLILSDVIELENPRSMRWFSTGKSLCFGQFFSQLTKAM